MRLTQWEKDVINQAVSELAGGGAQVRLYGSRIDDNALGGDIDLLVNLIHPVENPAWLIASLSGRISHRLGGRKIDVLLGAPNIKRFPIHDIANREGVAL